jgi:hypothetical protein
MSNTTKPFTVFLIQHSHIDIGYTERQEVIADYQRQFIGQAVRLANDPAQRSRADHLKFRFTCEGFWPVQLFLAKASAQEKKLLRAGLEEGTLELGATYLHFTELLDRGHLLETLQPARDYADSIGYDLAWAGAFDVNGFTAGWGDAMLDAGLRWFSTCINVHHGGRPFNRRNVPFCWQTPTGRKILVWEGQTYHRGNLYGLVPCSDSASGPAFPIGDLTLAESKLLPRIQRFRDEGFTLDFAPIYIGGLYTDNSPPTDVVCEHIAAWNDKHGDQVTIRLATMREFFQELEKHSEGFATHRGEWPDWWADGVASTPLETALFRNAQRVVREVERLDPQGEILTEERRLEIRQQLFLFAEHTWGYSDSVPSPWDFLCQQMVLRKGAMAVQADTLAMSALDEVLKKKHGAGDFVCDRPFRYRAINSQDVKRKALALLPVDFWEESHLRQGFRIEDTQGRTYVHQEGRFGRGQLIAVMLELEPGEERELSLVVTGEGRPARRDDDEQLHFENPYYRVEWDTEKGITLLIEKQSGANLLVEGDEALGMPVYQVFPSSPDEGTDPCSLRRQAGIKKEKPRDVVTRGKLVSVSRIQSGEVFETWKFRYEVPGASFYEVEFLFPRDASWIGIQARMNKENVWDPEGMYLAFPLAAEGGEWWLDRGAALMRPGVDQLPLSCCDYTMVQDAAALCGDKAGASVTLIDTPLVMVGGLKLWDYSKEGRPEGTLYSWQTNNKWETNFKASCGGFYDFRYVLDIGPELTDPQRAINRGRSHTSPIRVTRA